MFNTILFEPMYNLLVWITGFVPGGNIGVSIVLVTIIIKFILFPLTKKSIITQIRMRSLQDKLKVIQKQFKDNKQKLGEETMKLYKDNGVNPFTGIFLMIIQIPILWAIFKVFRDGIPFKAEHLYSFVDIPSSVSTVFLGMNLLEKSIILAIIVGIAQYLYMALLMPKKSEKKDEVPDMATKMQKNMLYFMPIFTAVITMSFPAALGLYWLVNTLFSIGQEYLVRKSEGKSSIPQVVK